MAYVFFILETDADQNWPNGHENAPRGSKNEIEIAHGAPKMQLGTPNGAQRRPKETSEEAKRDFGRAKVDPRAPRCAPREARMPPESAKVVCLRGATCPPSWANRAQRGAQKTNI